MRKLIAAILVAGAAVMGGSAVAADFPLYPPVIEIPDVNYGVQGSFYLRGSGAWNTIWAKEVSGYDCTPGCGGTVQRFDWPLAQLGYGYSVGAGFGYETGTGLRFDATLDYVSNSGATVEKTAVVAIPGKYSVNLRSTLALANVYYDFAFSDYGYGAAGGAFGYVGAGAGVAVNHVSVDAPFAIPSGGNTSLAAAAMVGVGYDFGAVVADLGYRAVYINHINNGATGDTKVWADNAWLHEVRGTLRYRFN